MAFLTETFTHKGVKVKIGTYIIFLLKKKQAFLKATINLFPLSHHIKLLDYYKRSVILIPHQLNSTGGGGD